MTARSITAAAMREAPRPAPLYVSMADATQVFSLSRDTFYRAANRGEITIHKRGARSLLKVAEVADWIEGRTPSEADNGGRLVGKSGAKT